MTATPRKSILKSVGTHAVCMAALCTGLPVFAQTASTPLVSNTAGAQPSSQPAAKAPKKWSLSWGWNRSGYSTSDIHFWGADHDFTLKNVVATDIQTDVNIDNIFGIYLNPKELTIPQTNMRLAYQWSPDLAIALNLDHMKYVMLADQIAPISGQIKGVAQSGNQLLSTNYLNFEHTDGLNIVTLEIEKQYPVDLFGPGFPSRLFGLAGIGIVVPKSNVTLNMLGRVRNDEFHFAGYSAGVGGGLEIDVYKDVFFRTTYKFGYVNLPDVQTSSQGDKASHRFTFNELMVAIGIRF